MGFLSEVLDEVRRRLERSPLDEARLMRLAVHLPPTRPFAGALRSSEAPAIIAEVKRASPSVGSIADAAAGERALAYEAGGATAISVLTEATHFNGSLADLRAVRLATSLPVLRKDFLVHPSQLMESRVEGADAVLLIAAALSEVELKAMLAAADDLGLGALVEAHGEDDLERAITAGAEVVGVNARDLETLAVDRMRAMELLARVPSDRIAILESGIATRAHVREVLAAGARGVLVGEALMRAEDPSGLLRELGGRS